MQYIRMVSDIVSWTLAMIVAMVRWLVVWRTNRRWWAAAALSLMVTGVGVHAQQQFDDDFVDVLYVDQANGDDINHDGTSWQDAFETIDRALNESPAAGWAIFVAEGEYHPDPTAGYILPNGVGLFGGFPEGGADFFDQEPNIYVTILDGDLGSSTALHLIQVLNATNDRTWIDGFTIRNGSAAGGSNEDDARGGGLLIVNDDEETPATCYCTVTRCRFESNSASLRGGAIAARRDNEASAAILEVDVTNCIFTGNESVNGGAIWVDGAAVICSNSLFYGNTASSRGGAIMLAQTCENATDCRQHECIVGLASLAYLQNCTVADNQATNAPKYCLGRRRVCPSRNAV